MVMIGEMHIPCTLQQHVVLTDILNLVPAVKCKGQHNVMSPSDLWWLISFPLDSPVHTQWSLDYPMGLSWVLALGC